MNNQYLPLHKAIVNGHKAKAMALVRQNPALMEAGITERLETPLHVAVAASKDARVVAPPLVNVVARGELPSLLDREGNTVLMAAAVEGRSWAAEMLIKRDSTGTLLWKPNTTGSTPLLEAAQYGNKRMVRYLLFSFEAQRQRLSEESRVRFVKLLLVARFYDLALYAIEKIKMLEPAAPGQPSPSIPQCYESFLEVVAGGPAPTSFWANLLHVKSLCAKISRSGEFSMFKKPLLLAAKLGVQEVVEEILKSYPDAIWFQDDEDHNIYHLSAIYRHENIFAFLCHMNGYKNMAIGIRDRNNKNILHLVAELTPSDKLSSVCGPALRMQYELQWYKEVEKHIQPSYAKEEDNHQQTPHMIFTKAHENLVRAGEKWMKGAATAGSVAATLIATVVFAAAINVPGGNKDGAGSPNYRSHSLFHVFLYSDGLALFLSISSVLMFMSILASGFGESDFLDLLANRLIFGLLSLLISLVAMLVAFWAAFLLALGAHLDSLAGYVLLQLTYIPGFLFIYLLYPLLVQMVALTWMPSIFRPPRTSYLHKFPILSLFLCVEQLHIIMIKWLSVLESGVIQFNETLLNLAAY